MNMIGLPNWSKFFPAPRDIVARQLSLFVIRTFAWAQTRNSKTNGILVTALIDL
jgi:hypothetical protein